jgi:hypothetical protein
MQVRDLLKKALAGLAILVKYTATKADDQFVAVATKFVNSDMLWAILEKFLASDKSAGEIVSAINADPVLSAACAEAGIPVESVPVVVAFGKSL